MLWKRIKAYWEILKLTWAILKEVNTQMVFTQDSAIVGAYIILFAIGNITTIEGVPNMYNLREAVAEAVGLKQA